MERGNLCLCLLPSLPPTPLACRCRNRSRGEPRLSYLHARGRYRQTPLNPWQTRVRPSEVTGHRGAPQRLQGLRTVRALVHANGTPTTAMQHENEDARVTQRGQPRIKPRRWFGAPDLPFLCLSSRLRGGTTIRLEKEVERFKRPTPFAYCGGGGEEAGVVTALGRGGGEGRRFSKRCLLSFCLCGLAAREKVGGRKSRKITHTVKAPNFGLS